MTTPKTHEYKCPRCGKEIYSLYQKQLNHLIQQHSLVCPALPIKKEEGVSK